MKQPLILIIDDEAAIVRMLSRRLRRAGYRIEAAPNGVEGLQKALELKPDLILLDMHMPKLDGFEVVKRLRAQNYSGKVAACSASVSVRDSQATLDAGCNYFISKPIGLDFETIIQQILNEQEGQDTDH